MKQWTGKEHGTCFLSKICLQNVPPFVEPCVVVLHAHSKDMATSDSLLCGMQRQGRLKDEACILPGAREYCNQYEQVFLVFLFTIMIHSYSRIHSSPPPSGVIHGIVSERVQVKKDESKISHCKIYFNLSHLAGDFRISSKE